jgi:membrane protein required for beta-lactamase induction
MKKPSLGSILLGLVPFGAVCFSVPLWDRVYPIILGLPFNFFWLMLWILLTPFCMWGAYRLEVSQSSDAAEREKDAS